VEGSMEDMAKARCSFTEELVKFLSTIFNTYKEEEKTSKILLWYICRTIHYVFYKPTR